MRFHAETRGWAASVVNETHGHLLVNDETEPFQVAEQPHRGRFFQLAHECTGVHVRKRTGAHLLLPEAQSHAGRRCARPRRNRAGIGGYGMRAEATDMT